MMIGKAALAHHGKAPVPQVIEKGRRITNAAKGKKLALPALAFRQNFGHQRRSDYRVQSRLRVKHGSARESAYHGLECRSMARPRDDHNIRACQP